VPIFALTAGGRCEWKLSGGGNVHGSGMMGRPCSDFMDMLRRLISRRIIIIMGGCPTLIATMSD